MTHQRARFIDDEFRKKLSYSPCVGVLGMRQVGKSTLIKKFSSEYHTLDEQAFLVEFEKDPQSFLAAAKYPLALDEAQKSPLAFDAIKFAIDQKKTPGRFILSGSVRFSSRKQIRESLTGRIVLIELLPFTLAECHGKALSSFVNSLEKNKMDSVIDSLKRNSWVTGKGMADYLKTGGLPGICFRRDETVRAEMYETHLETLLSRDIQMIRNIKLSYSKLRLILAEINLRQSLALNMSDLARKVGTSVPTIKVILEAFEGLFLIKHYGQSYFVADEGLSNHLLRRDEHLGRIDFTCLMYHELSAQINYTAKLRVIMQPYQTRGGIDVPFFLEYKTGKRVAIFVEETDRPSHKVMNSVAWLTKKFPELEAVTFYQSNEIKVTSKGMPCVPMSWVF